MAAASDEAALLTSDTASETAVALGEALLATSYEADRTYVVRLTVVDNAGVAATASREVVVEDAAPSAGLAVHDAGGGGDLTVAFVDETAMADLADIIHDAWDFGDGEYRAGGRRRTACTFTSTRVPASTS